MFLRSSLEMSVSFVFLFGFMYCSPLFISLLFYHFSGGVASAAGKFSPFFQKYVRAFLNLSKMGRIIKELNDIIFGGFFS